MNLYILRHGLAGKAKSPDAAVDRFRRLTPAGVKKMKRAARGMQTLDLQFDLILASPYLRTKETAMIVAKTLDSEKLVRFSVHLTPTGSDRALIGEVKAAKAENVLLVGHEPSLSRLISWLISGKTEAQVTMEKGSLAKLKVAELRLGRCAQLEWLLTPAQLRALGKS